MADDPQTSLPKPADELVARLDKAIRDFLFTKRRHPLLLATAEEIDLLGAKLTTKNGGTPAPIMNDGVLQLLRDSFDMLVIDLFSIRESLIEKPGGVFELLKLIPERLRRVEPAEFWPPPAPGEDEREAWARTHQGTLIAKGINEALGRLVGDRYPATREVVTDLTRRFIKQTEPLDRDRNHVRAHRFEYRPFDRDKYFQPLADLGSQVETFDRYLLDLYLVITHNGYSLRLPFMASEDRTSQDLADLLLHGSINAAVNAYEVVKETPENPRPWYWAFREKLFRGGGA